MVTQKATFGLPTNIMKRNVFKLVTHMLYKNLRLIYIYKYHLFNVNKNPTRCNGMQIFIYCKVALHVSGVTAPIIRVLKSVTAASGTGHNIGTATSPKRDLIQLRCTEP